MLINDLRFQKEWGICKLQSAKSHVTYVPNVVY
ncbi:hypothetical protein SAMN05444285_11736 [Draconibacterium orientale]|uniref:Uncharacterized protein n=1 Tax=Draconibacterium orientale TaxID=1168034 RepID=A0A1I0FMG6_9BACT|nr:hypothetical protein SAMN05444285_11736 [Draconibacterium orientale]